MITLKHLKSGCYRSTDHSIDEGLMTQDVMGAVATALNDACAKTMI